MRVIICFMLITLAFAAAAAKSGTGGRVQPASSNMSLDGELAYKTNCTRCHSAPPTLSPRQAGVVLRHMRVKANLPAGEAEAILQYLLQSDGGN
jgi:cytochrome c5